MVEIWWQNCQGNESRGTIDQKEDTDHWFQRTSRDAMWKQEIGQYDNHQPLLI